jgi:tRNA-Thr(GGU) m(6)t(6)A37 methyltransferase TsaA
MSRPSRSPSKTTDPASTPTSSRTSSNLASARETPGRDVPGAPRARLVDGLGKSEYLVRPIGVIRSTLRAVTDAPNQAFEGAPEASLQIDPALADALHRIEPGDELILLTWLHLADRDVLQVHPRGDESIPLTGVVRTRSPARPNPIGLHRVTVIAREGATTLLVGALEAIDGTPVIDLKVVMDDSRDE